MANIASRPLHQESPDELDEFEETATLPMLEQEQMPTRPLEHESEAFKAEVLRQLNSMMNAIRAIEAKLEAMDVELIRHANRSGDAK